MFTQRKTYYTHTLIIVYIFIFIQKPFITFACLSVACTNYYLIYWFFLSACSIVMVMKEKHSLVNLKAIVIILECFLYWTMDFKVGWSMFPHNGSNLLKFYALSNSGNLEER